MNFELTEDQKRVRDAVREFAATRDRARASPSARRPSASRARSSTGSREMGILGMMVPEEYGGAGSDALSYILAIEELARVCASTAVIVSVTNSVFCYPDLEVRHRGAEEDDSDRGRLRARPSARTP